MYQALRGRQGQSYKAIGFSPSNEAEKRAYRFHFFPCKTAGLIIHKRMILPDILHKLPGVLAQLAVVFSSFSSGRSFAQPPTAPHEALSPHLHAIAEKLRSTYSGKLTKSRYMEKACQPVTWPGWEGYPTIKCHYSVTDSANSNTKSADVVMLNASAEQIATWAVTAAVDAGSTRPAIDADKVFRQIISQSGGQFPIAGIVYEDMEGDGYFDAFCFRNGVTVRVAGVQHRTTATLTAAQLEASLSGPIERVYTYARIASTTPAQYRDNGGTIDVGTNTDRTRKWPQVVGTLYRAAWNCNRNDLISAWAKDALQPSKSP